jgi:hypothetical protein
LAYLAAILAGCANLSHAPDPHATRAESAVEHQDSPRPGDAAASTPADGSEAAPAERTTFGTDPDAEPSAIRAIPAVVPSERPLCPDGCTNANSAPQRTTPGSIACSLDITWSSPSWIENHTWWMPTRNLRADSNGNMYYVGSFTGRVDLGLGEISADWQDAFVLKLSPSCTPIWVKEFGGRDGRTMVNFTAIAIDADDDLLIAGDMNGSADFGAGEITTLTSDENHGNSGLVLEFAPDGTLLWSRTLSGVAGTYLEGIGVTDSGDVIVSGRGDSAVHFDGMTAPEELAYASVFTASVSAGGQAGAIHHIISTNVFGTIAVDGSGRLAISGWAYNASGTGAFAGFDWGANLYDHYLLVLDPSGTLAWSRHFEQLSEEEQTHGSWESNTEFDRDGNLILAYGRSTFEDDDTVTRHSRVVRKVDPSGTDVWSRSSQYAGGGIMWTGKLATDAHDDVVYVDEITTDTTLDGEAFDVRGKRDFLVRKRDANGELIGSTQLGGDGDDFDWALATDADDAVWVGSEQIDAEFTHATITVTKLVP